MRKTILFFLTLTMMATIVMGQAKKPSIMVVPSDVWCSQRGYMKVYENQGEQMSVPDYKRALQSDDQLGFVISKLGSMMADRGFPLNTLEAALARIEQTNARNNMMTSKRGSSIAENPIDLLNRTAKADILMKLTWTLKQDGPKKYVVYTLQGIDPYTGKQIAGAEGVGSPSFSASEDILLEEAVLVNMDNFCIRLQAYFDDLMANGREVSLDIMVWDDAGFDLEEEYNGQELAEIIDDWISDNTVEHRYSKAEGSETYARYDQVRIALYDIKGKPQDTETFARGLRSFLKKTYQIECKVVPYGLGNCQLILGGK